MTVVIGSQLAGQVMHGVSRKRDPSLSLCLPHILTSLFFISPESSSSELGKKYRGLTAFSSSPPIYQLCLVLKTSTFISTTKLPIKKKSVMASNPPFALQSLLEKMSSPDSDYRFMSLNDLLSILTSPNGSLAQADTALAGRVIDGVVKALDDANGEVQNLAVKW